MASPHPQPTFPVMCLSRDGSISVADSAEALRRCNARALFKNHYYEDLIVIDSAENRFRVVSAAPVPTPSSLGRLVARVLNRKMTVDLVCEPEGPIHLDDAKRTVNEWLDRSPDFWEASRDVEVWRQMIARANSASSLIGLFS